LRSTLKTSVIVIKFFGRLVLKSTDDSRGTVAVRFTMTGVHVGEFLGIPPTGKAIRRTSMAFFHIRDGKIADSYTIADMYGMMHELQKG